MHRLCKRAPLPCCTYAKRHHATPRAMLQIGQARPRHGDPTASLALHLPMHH